MLSDQHTAILAEGSTHPVIFALGLIAALIIGLLVYFIRNGGKWGR